MSKPSLTVLYDAECPLCCRLAEHGRRLNAEGLQFIAWQDHTENAKGRPPELCVVTGEKKLVGVDAWEMLIKHHPSLGGLSWAAQKLGLTRSAARVLRSTGKFVRRFCRSCSGF